jgi:hypothetical protein
MSDHMHCTKADAGFMGGSNVATGFWDGVVGVLMALVWPAFLIYHLFTFLKI